MNAFSEAECADADAALLLENIKYLNFVSEDRHDGFDVNTTLAILKVFELNGDVFSEQFAKNDLIHRNWPTFTRCASQ